MFNSILHLTSSFYPDSTGGTESYVQQLADKQVKEGHNVAILRLGNMPDYSHKGLPVSVVERTVVNKLDYYGGLKTFVPLDNKVVALTPHEVYIHDRDPHFSAEIINGIKKQLPNCRFTGVYHSPGQSCPNRSLINQHHNICDGELITKRCTECRISKSKGAFLGKIIAKYSAKNNFINERGLEEITHANYFTNRYTAAFKKWVNALDSLQYHADWVKDVLLLNGVEEEKLSYVPLESIYDFEMPSTTTKKIGATDTIKIVCSGRCTNIKGQLLLLQALENLNAETQEKIELHFIGPGFDADDQYAEQVRQKIEALDFVHPPQLLKPEDVPIFLSDKHIGIVPSLWPETGPLVVLDFLNAGMKVLSTPFIGIKNSAIQHFEYANALSLRDELEQQINAIKL